MRKRSSFLALGILAAMGSGCAHSIHQYSVSDTDSLTEKVKAGRAIEADAEQFVILSFTTSTDFADEAYERLLQNCPQGEIVGINARYSTSMHFLSYTNKMHLQATCIE